MRKAVLDTSFWKNLSTHFSAENDADVIMQDHALCVKSICAPIFLSLPLASMPHTSYPVQLLDDEPFELLEPTVEKLLENNDKDKQRAAAEFLGGLICGMLYVCCESHCVE